MKKKQTQKQPVCKKKKFEEKKVAVDKSKTVSKFGVKQILRVVLMNPTTWRWVMVHLPDLVEKGEFYIKKVISFFTDFNF